MSLYLSTNPAFTLPANPTDVAIIVGSATRIVKVFRIILNTSQSTLGFNVWQIIKRTSPNSGGTLVALSSVPYDSLDPAATAVASAYTVNPTSLGVASGVCLRANICSPANTSVTADGVYVFDFANYPIILRGTNESMSINFGGAAKPTGLVADVTFIFDEAQ